MKKIIIVLLVSIILFTTVAGIYIYTWSKTHGINEKLFGFISGKSEGLVDDWKYNSSKKDTKWNTFLTANSFNSKVNNSGLEMSVCDSAEQNIGLTVGGSKNINNFRENIKNGYFPISTDITYNGVFYDYYFNTGKNENNSEDLFSPTYSTAISKDPISGKNEYYMTVGLNSNIKQSDFVRKKLNLVVVLDISGSMESSWNSYYYDGESQLKDNKSKMKVANESVNLLIDELKEGDRFGMVLFDDSSYLAKPLELVEKTDLKKIKEHVLEITPEGGTNFSAGYSSATELFNNEMLDNQEYENRIIVITDAMPNLGNVSKDSLATYVKNNADKRLYTTFIGVGIDFNTEVIECLSNVKGSNYYSVHNSEEFAKIMSEDFEYMVTPLVFDLKLNLESEKFDIENVYGTDCKDKENGTIMKVNTLFPSNSKSTGEVKGGIILVKLKCKYEKAINESINTLKVSYLDRDGKEHSNTQNIKFEDTLNEYYENTGIRKGILLTRYVNLMKSWILNNRIENKELPIEYRITDLTGIKDCSIDSKEVFYILGEHERSSVSLKINEEYKDLMKKFKQYFEIEMKELNDEELQKEIDILKFLIEM